MPRTLIPKKQFADGSTLDDLFQWDGSDWQFSLPGSVASSIDLNDLADVDAAAPTNNYVLTFNSGSGNWEPAVGGGGGGGATELDDLSDVTITTPNTGEVLQHNGSIWVNGQLDYSDLAGSIGVDDLDDVTITAVSDGQFLQYNSGTGQWANVSIAPGGALTGGGVAGRVAYWSTAVNLTHDSELLWDATSNRLSIGVSPASAGAIALPNNNLVNWKNAAGSGDLGIKLGTDDKFQLSHTSTNTIELSSITSGSTGLFYKFSRTGTGTANVIAEGYFAAHMSNDFSNPVADNTEAAVRLPNNTKIGWRNAADNGNLGFGVNASNEYEFTASGSVSSIDFTTNVSSGNPLAYKFSRAGTGVSSLWVEDYFAAHGPSGSGFGTSVATVGLFRVPNNLAIISARNAADSGNVEVIKVTTGNRVRLAGLSDWPAANSSGVLLNNGSGDLSWTTPVTALTHLSDVTISSAVSGEVLRYNGSLWVDAQLNYSDLAGSIGLNNLSDVTLTTPVTNNVLRYNGSIWVNVTPATMAANISLDNLSDVTITSPATNAVLLWNGSAWIDSTVPGPSSGGSIWSTTNGNKTIYFAEYSGPTAGAAVIVSTGTLTDESCYHIEGVVVNREAPGAIPDSGKITGTAVRDGGTLSIAGQIADYEYGGTIALAVSGNTVQLKWTGAVASGARAVGELTVYRVTLDV